MKKLIIVESPAKSSTISKYLGKDFMIGSSMGHVRDLNPKILSIDVENGYKPHYEELKDKKRIIQELKKLSKKADVILLAPDPDREGEAIAFHLKEILKNTNSNIYRIFFNEITKNAVLKAIENPVDIDMNKVNSQQMRRVLDRLAGYKISPVLQRKIGGPLSAGRVQSVALKLIVEREKEIESFVPEEYWTIAALLEGSKKPEFNAKLEKHNKKKIKIKNEKESNNIVEILKSNDFILSEIKKKEKKKNPLPPLITSTLQQEAFKRHKFPVKKTMRIAQELYEGIEIGGGEKTGIITYMRTDSFRLSNESLQAAKEFIEEKYGKDFHPQKFNFYKNKSKAQDAHEAIRPTLPLNSPSKLMDFLSSDQYKIYKIIWDRFIASQMKSAIIEETIFNIDNSGYLFISKGEIIKFEGFLKVIKPDSESSILPDLKEKEVLKLMKLDAKQNFTKPPVRYTEASLVKVLEEKGIGRPSTYAKIIDTLGKREYVIKEDRKFKPTFLGKRVVEFLENNFEDIMDYNFTADLEKQLDLVSEGKLEWKEGIDRFYKRLSKDMEKTEKKDRVMLYVGRKCPECGKELVQKYSSKTNGWFIGCEGYPECKYTERIDDNGKKIKEPEILDKKCPECGSPLVKRYSPKTKSYFIGCSAYPRCNYIENVKEDLGNCPVCGKPLVKRYSRKTRRHFIACSGYPECKYIKK